MIAVLERGDSMATFTPPAPGAVQPDGSVRLVTPEGAHVEIAAPWARDAAGRLLPTTYTTKGRHLIQSVDTEGATFPIAADPSVINCGWFTPCVKFSRSETLRISDAVVVGVGASVATLCGLIPWTPVYLAAFKAACAGYVAGNFANIRSNAVTAKNTGRCLAIRVTTTGVPLGARVVTC